MAKLKKFKKGILTSLFKLLVVTQMLQIENQFFNLITDNFRLNNFPAKPQKNKTAQNIAAFFDVSKCITLVGLIKF